MASAVVAIVSKFVLICNNIVFRGEALLKIDVKTWVFPSSTGGSVSGTLVSVKWSKITRWATNRKSNFFSINGCVACNTSCLGVTALHDTNSISYTMVVKHIIYKVYY